MLLLDDEADLLILIGSLLREEGYNVVTAETAEDALQVLQSNSPDIILADVKLPGMDGMTFFAEVQKMENLKSVPFVFVTAYNDEEGIQLAKRLGASAYITKPFDFGHLLKTVHQLVSP